MAFDPANLTVSNSTPAYYTLDYTTTDSIADVEHDASAPYFPFGIYFRVNDLVRVTASDGKGVYFLRGGNPPFVKVAVASSFPSF